MSELRLNFENELSNTACQRGPTPVGISGHDVQFYRTEQYLTRAVVEFLAGAMRAGQPIIVIATREHRAAFQAGLRSEGLDPDLLFSGRLAVWLDARETLDAFMEGGRPDRELFYATVGSVFQMILDKRSYLVVRTFGEMVDVLFKDGNVEGAIALEKLWNELGEKYNYSLLCGYSLDNFLHEKGVDAFRNVCGHHTHALPLESLDQNVA
ncbi:MAG TPA: MEDS domain-containing protein [Gemmatimonadaceae bacterium]